MHDRVRLALLHEADDLWPFGDLALHELDVAMLVKGRIKPRRARDIEGNNIVAARRELLDHTGSDEPGAACDENASHVIPDDC